MRSSNDALNTFSGMLLAVVVAHPSQLLDTFIIGLLGAMGAYLGNMLIKWIMILIQYKPRK